MPENAEMQTAAIFYEWEITVWSQWQLMMTNDQKEMLQWVNKSQCNPPNVANKHSSRAIHESQGE